MPGVNHWRQQRRLQQAPPDAVDLIMPAAETNGSASAPPADAASAAAPAAAANPSSRLSQSGRASPSPARPTPTPYPGAPNSARFGDTSQAPEWSGVVISEAPPPVIVTNATGLQEALERNAVDIEIRAHLNLLTLERKENPVLEPCRSVVTNNKLRESGEIDGKSHSLYASSTTRSIRGNCTSPVDEALQAAWREHMSGSPLLRKSSQCLILAGSKALFAQSGHLWLHNLYLAAAIPNPRRQALHLSTGYVGSLAISDFFKTSMDNNTTRPVHWPACSRQTDLSVYVTDAVLQSSPHAGSTAVALMPLTTKSSVSLLAQNSMFIGMGGMTPPFLVTRYSRAHFSNCLFRDIFIQGHELFDVSYGGGVRLTNCSFANVTVGRDIAIRHGVSLVDTSYNDDGGTYSQGGLKSPDERCSQIGIYDFDERYDFNLTNDDPGPQHLGVDAWVGEEMVVDDHKPYFGGDTEMADEYAAGEFRCNIEERQLDGRLGRWLSGSDDWLVQMQQLLEPEPTGQDEAFANGLPTCEGCASWLSTLERLERSSAGMLTPNCCATAALHAPPPGAAPAASNSRWTPTAAVLVGVMAVLVAAVAAAAVVIVRRSRRRHRRRRSDGTGGKTVAAAGGSSRVSHDSGHWSSHWSSRLLGIFRTPPATPSSHRLKATGGTAVKRHTAVQLTRATAHSMHITSSTASSGVGTGLDDEFKYKLPRGLSLLDGPSARNHMHGAYVHDDEAHPLADSPHSAGAHAFDTDAGQSRPSSAVARLVRAALGPSGGTATPAPAMSDAHTVMRGAEVQLAEGMPGAGGQGATFRGRSAGEAWHTSSPDGGKPLLPFPPEDTRTGGEAEVQPHACTSQQPQVVVESGERRRAAAEADGAPQLATPSGCGGSRLPPRGHLFTTEDMAYEADEDDGPALAASVRAPAVDVWPKDEDGRDGCGEQLKLLHRQLDRFMSSDKFLGVYEMLGRWERRQGGQAIIQFARDTSTEVYYAVKFFVDAAAFRDEVAIYSGCMPAFTKIYKPPSAQTRPLPPGQNDASSSTTLSLTRIPSSLHGGGTLNAVSAAYSIGIPPVSSSSSVAHTSRSRELTGDIASSWSRLGPLSRLSRRLNAWHQPAVPLGLVNIGEDDSTVEESVYLPPGEAAGAGSVSPASAIAATLTPIPSGATGTLDKGGVQDQTGASGCNTPAAPDVSPDNDTMPMLPTQIAGAGAEAKSTEPQTFWRETYTPLSGGMESDGGGSVRSSADSLPVETENQTVRHAIPRQPTTPQPHSLSEAATGALLDATTEVINPETTGASAKMLHESPATPAGAKGGPKGSPRVYTPGALGWDWGSDADALFPSVAAKFLPQVAAVCEAGAAELVDPQGRPLPPCIVMEKGESLHDWSERAEPDLFACVSVLSNVATRVADMHAVDLVHRDLKPANIMWLPRENRWTVIDFGSATRAGATAQLSFTLAYAAPEVIATIGRGCRRMEVFPAVDAWALGVMAFELLTGAPAFRFLTDGSDRVVAQLRGDLPLPWEGDLSTDVKDKLGVFREPVLQLLHRDPARRATLQDFADKCHTLFQ